MGVINGDCVLYYLWCEKNVVFSIRIQVRRCRVVGSSNEPTLCMALIARLG